MPKLPKNLKRTIVYESDWIKLCLDRVEMPTGTIIDPYHQLVFPFESVVVLVLNEQGELCMIESLRYSTQTVEWEIPAGRIENNQTIEQAAVKEVGEETGYRLDQVKYLQFYNPSNGMSNEVMHVVWGKAVEKLNTGIDTDEVEAVYWKNEVEVRQMIRERKIKDGISLVPILLWLNKLI